MNKPLILIADDERRINKLVSDFLKRAGFDVICAEDGEQALELFCELGKKISLVILDVMMPRMNGWEVLEQIRKISDVLIIMLTARSEDDDQLAGFRSGADDYVTKPFSPSVLVARVAVLLKRQGRLRGQKHDCGGFELDTEAHIVYVNGDEITLTPKEYDLLLYFVNNRGITMSREKLLNAVWNYDYYGDVRTVDTHVKQLRAKLGDAGVIQTVRGAGYRFASLGERGVSL